MGLNLARAPKKKTFQIIGGLPKHILEFRLIFSTLGKKRKKMKNQIFEREAPNLVKSDIFET